MPRDRLTFRQRDMTAALKAAKAAGVPVARIDVKPEGGFVIIVGEPDGSTPDLDARRRVLQKLEDLRTDTRIQQKLKDLRNEPAKRAKHGAGAPVPIKR